MTYFLFRLPGSCCYIRAIGPDAATAILRRNSYEGAPVASWPRWEVATEEQAMKECRDAVIIRR